MDSLDLFPRGAEGGPLPFLLLDGHGSRFQLPFLRCTGNKDHKWNVCVGVPNGTAYWQVGRTERKLENGHHPGKKETLAADPLDSTNPYVDVRSDTC
jgi:hypothetical protein